MDKVLVTGADGFLGNNVIRELLKRKYSVKGFLHRDHHTDAIDDLAIEQYHGDLLNAYEVIAASADCRYIIHTAASTAIWPARSALVRQVNIKGTKNVVTAALQPHIKRLVYVGTASSFGFGTKECPGNENTPFISDKYGLDYIDSKKQAQDMVLAAVAGQKLPAIIVNPTFMIGPHDSKPSSGALLLALYRGKVPGYTSGGRNFLYVKDAAQAIVEALNSGRIGECYILGNQNLTYKEFYDLVGRVLGVKPPGLFIPRPFILLFGILSQLFSQITGRPADISLPVAKISLDNHYFSAEKAIKELDLPQTPIHTAIKEAFAWFKENNYLSPANESHETKR
jgi:dihydroflavonol-4-reductase